MQMSSALDDVSFLARSQNRVDVLNALSEEAASRRELTDDLGVERVTLGRILTDFTDRHWVIKVDDRYELTFVGELVADQFDRTRVTMDAARRLAPLVPLLPVDEMEFPLVRLTDATVTTASEGDPYSPVRRFMSLLRDSTTLRGYDTTTIAPLYVDEIREQILAGMDTEVVYLPQVARQIVDDYGDAVRTARESGHLRLHVAESLPFGLAVYDDRVGIGAYDDETGMLSVFVDTDDEAVREWALDRYRQHRELAQPLENWLSDSA